MYRLVGITIFPVKSLDGMAVDAATILPCGALQNDRRYALRDSQGRWLNGKANPDIQRLRATFAPDASAVTIDNQRDGGRAAFCLPDEKAELERWFGAYFNDRVMLVEETRGGFPDDTDSPGPTVVSRQSLAAIGTWYGGLPIDEVRARFRANLEIDGDAPFCEDRLVAAHGQVVRFEIGEVAFEGVNPCQRCPVPTRHPQTAVATPYFARRFAEQREATLPAWTNRGRFDHFYRFSVNTRLSPTGAGGVLRVGDEVRVGAIVAG